jgi:tetratricopeptide (TPR) repeat protein
MTDSRKIVPIFLAALALGMAPAASGAPQDADQRRAQAREILREACRLLKDWPAELRSSSAARVAGLQARAGDVVGALETASSLPNLADRADALGTVAWKLAQAGDLAGALNALQGAEDGERKDSWYSVVAIVLANQGDFAGARRVAAMIQEQADDRVQVITRIAVQQHKAGDDAAAKKTMEEALAAADREHTETPDAAVSAEPEILASISEAQDAMGDHSGALRTLERLRRLVAQSQPGSKDELLKLFARAQATVGEAAAAAETANQIPINAATTAPGGSSPIPVGESREFNLYLVAKFVAKKGDVRGAREVAAGISIASWQAFAYGDIAKAQIAAGDFAGAQETFALITDDAARAFHLARVAMELLHESDPGGGRLLRLAAAAGKVPHAELPPWYFASLSMARAESGDFAGAKEAMAGMKDSAPRAAAQRALVEAMARAGDVRGALALADAPDAPKPKFEMLNSIAKGILDAIDAEKKKSAAGN